MLSNSSFLKLPHLEMFRILTPPLEQSMELPVNKSITEFHLNCHISTIEILLKLLRSMSSLKKLKILNGNFKNDELDNIRYISEILEFF